MRSVETTSPRVSRTEEIRSRIKAAALDLFLSRGFARSGVRQIAGSIGVSVGTIFNYFDSKEQILYALIFEMQKGVAVPLQAAARKYREQAAADGDPEQSLRMLLSEYARAVDVWRAQLLLAHQETRSLRREQLREILDGERRMGDLLADVIRIGVERGKFRPGDLHFRAHAIQIMVQSWATRRWALPRDMTLDNFIASVERSVLAMLKGA